MNFRPLTDQEKQQLAEHFLQTGACGDTIEEIIEWMEGYPIIAYDNYISDGPGYVGKFIFCMYGYPEAYEVFVFREGKLEKIDSELNGNYS